MTYERHVRVHESGHVVAALSFNIPVESVTVVAGEGYDGRTMWHHTLTIDAIYQRGEQRGLRLRYPTIIRQLIKIRLAGSAAERIVLGSHIQGGDRRDMEQVEELMIELRATGSRITLDRMLDQTEELLRQRPRQLLRLERALAVNPTLDGEAILRAVGRRAWR